MIDKINPAKNASIPIEAKLYILYSFEFKNRLKSRYNTTLVIKNKIPKEPNNHLFLL